MAYTVCSHAREIIALGKVKNSTEKRNRIIDEAGIDLVHCICDCARNVISKNIPLTVKEKKRLKRYKNWIEELAHKQTSDRRRKYLIQKGGFLSALIPTLVSLVGKLFTG